MMLRGFAEVTYGWLLLLLLAIPGQLAAQVDADEGRFVEALRQRRLFNLAATYCQRQLDRPGLGAPQRAWWTAELVRVWGEAALHASGEQQEAAWQRARKVAADYLQQHAQDIASVWVRLQQALLETAYGKVLRQTAEAARHDPTLPRQAALAALRQAARQWEELERWLDQLIPTLPAQVPPGHLTADDLFAIRNQVRLLRAEVLQHQAECYPAGPDQVGLLLESVQAVENALAQLPADDPLAWRARFQQVVCQRLLGNLQDAETNLRTLRNDDVPPEMKVLADAEHLRLLVAQGRWLDAWQELTRSAFGDRQVPEWDLAAVEVLVALWRQRVPVPAGVAGSWRQLAVAHMKHIEERHGPYWGRLAERLLLDAASEGGAGEDVELLRRRADDLFLSGRLSEALAAYDEAARAAQRARLADEEWLCRGRAARLAEQLGQMADAAERWRQAALAFVEHPQAAAAHTESLRLATQATRQGLFTLQQYREWLQEHLHHWPESSSSDRVRLALIHQLLTEKKWDDVLAVCAHIRDGDYQLQAIPLAEKAWRAKLEQADSINRASQVVQMEDYFQQLYSSSSSATVAAERLLSVSALLIQFAPHQAAHVERRLSAVDVDVVSPEQLQRLRTLQLWAVAVQPNRSEDVSRLLSQLPKEPGHLYRDLAARLAEQLAQAGSAEQRVLAEVQLQLLDRYQPGTALDEQWQWMRWRAEALFSLGRAEEALAGLESLTRQHPQHGRIQLECARLLEAAAPQIGYQRVLERWRVIAAASPVRSDPWYEAKLAVARALAAMGKPQEAEKLVRYVLLTAPPPADSLWNRRYREFLHTLQP